MAIAKVLIPGKFDDAFLYMGRLFAAQADGSLVTLDLDSAIEDLADNSRIPFLTAAFSRNDQIGLAATRAGWPTDWLEAALDGMSWEIRPATKNIGQVETIFKGAHLDFTVYNRRIYVARTDGIFHADVDVH